MALDLLERPPEDDVYDDERDAVGLSNQTSPSPGSLSNGVLNKISPSASQHPGFNLKGSLNDSNKSATDEINALKNVGKGFTGASAGALTGVAPGGSLKNAAGVAAKVKALSAQIGQNASDHKGAYTGVGAGITTIVIAFVGFSALPGGFKTVMNRMTNKANMVIGQNVAQYQESLISEYFKKQLAPGMKRRAKEGCTSTLVQTGCADKTQDTSPPGRTLNAWAASSIENDWAKNGFELRYDTISNRYFIRATGIVGDIDITDYLHTSDNLFHEIGKPELRTLIQAVNEKTSRIKRIMNLFGVGRLIIHNKWRISRCVDVCKASDKINLAKDSLIDRKNGYRIKFAQRVLYPRSKILGLAFACLFSGSACDPNKPDVNEQTGEYNTKFEEDIQSTMNDILTEQGGDETLKKAQEVLKGLREDGWQKYLIKLAVSEILSKSGASDATAAGTAKIAGEAVPFLGILNSATGLISQLSSIGPGLKAVISMTQKDSMTRSYAMDSTYADEVTSGNVDSVEVDSFGRSFDAGQELQPDGIHYGGPSAQASPLYTAFINDGNQTTTTAFGGVFASASADSTKADPYHLNTFLCQNNKPVLSGELICPEQALNYAGYIAKTFGSISNFLNAPGMNIITEASKFWTSVVGGVASTITKPLVDLVMQAPGYSALTNAITSAIQGIFQSLVTQIVPNWINDNMSGGNHFVADVGGALAVANDYGENYMGGQPLSLAQRASIENDELAVEQKTFQMQPMVARIFNQNDPHSLVSNLSLALPYDLRPSIASMFTNLLANPFGQIIHSLATVFTIPNAWAATTQKTVVDAGFGFTTFGIPIDNAVYSTEPTTYWASNCTTDAHSKAWNASVKINPTTGLPEHTASDPCRLVDQASRIGGGYRDSNLANGK